MTIETILEAAKRAYQKCLRSSRLPKVQISGRKNIYALLVSLILCGGIYSFWKDSGKPLNSLSNSTTEQTDPPEIIFNELSDNRMSRVIKDAMVHSWKAYRMYAWGMDVTNPIKLSGSEWMGAALTMIDSLDTLWIMGLTKEFDDARGWIAANLTFDKNNDHINLFETTIRVLGGLLSAYHLSKDDLFLQKAKELGSLLLVAFHSSSSFPLPDLNFAHRTAHHSPQYRDACLSEMAVQLEFNQFSLLTNDVRFAVRSGKILRRLHSLPTYHGLLPNFIDREGGPNWDSRIGIGAHGDSYYEYLLKVWIQTGKKINALRDDYRKAIKGIQDHLVGYSKPNNLMFIGELNDGDFTPLMDHLVCFLPGTLILGYRNGMPRSHMKMAEQLLETCFQLYNQTETGLSPEIARYSTDVRSKKDFTPEEIDTHNILRPEVIESLFYAYQQTKESKYREWGAAIFNAFMKYSRLTYAGFAGIKNVSDVNSARIDQMDSFWLSETLKYFFLLFDEAAASKYSIDKWLFNTEAHLFPISSNTENPLIKVYFQLYAL